MRASAVTYQVVLLHILLISHALLRIMYVDQKNICLFLFDWYFAKDHPQIVLP